MVSFQLFCLFSEVLWQKHSVFSGELIEPVKQLKKKNLRPFLSKSNNEKLISLFFFKERTGKGEGMKGNS